MDNSRKGRFVLSHKNRVISLRALSYVVVAAVVVFIINLFVQGPTIHADEGSYLANAAALAGYPNDLASSYHAGYSMLIAPAFWIADTPQGIWTIVKAINAMLFATTVIGLWLVAKHLNPTTTSQNRFAAVALVSLYPMWVTMAGYSFAQIAFVPVFLFMFLIYMRSIRGGLSSWLILGLVSGFLYWIHPTAVALLMAVSISAAYITWYRRNYMAFLALLLTIFAMVLLYRFGVTPWLHERMNISGLGAHTHYPDILRLLAPLMSIEGIKWVIAHAAGQFFYLSVGTVGLIWLGLFSLTTQAIRNSSPIDNELRLRNRAIAVFIWLSLAGIVALPALMFSQHPGDIQRLDIWIYGRYVEGMIAPILLAGALTMSFRKVLWAVPIAMLCAVLLSLELDSYKHVARLNIPAFWQDFVMRGKGLWAWLAAGCALIILVAAIPRRIGMLVVAFVFFISSFFQVIWHTALSIPASGRWGAALKIRDQFPPGTCVGFDHSGIDSYKKSVFWYDFWFILFDYKLKRIGFEQWLDTCDGPLFSYTKGLDAAGVEVYPIAASLQGGPMVWMKGRLPALESIYPMIVSDRTIALLRTIGKGWHDLERTHIWSSPDAQLKLPVPDGCSAVICSAKMTISVYGASEARPVEVIFKTDSVDTTPPPRLIARSSLHQHILVPLPGNKPVLNLSISIPDAISPHALQGSRDQRVLGVALHSIELITHSPLQ